MLRNYYVYLNFLWTATIAVPSLGFTETEINVPKITVSGQALIRKPADELRLTVGVVNLAANAEAALAENSSKMQAVISSLKDAGLVKSEYETGHFSIHPTYTPYPKDPPPDWKPSINGYEVSNSIAIRTAKLDLAGKLIDTANKAGANSIENIHFTLQDPRSYSNDVISAAVANAAKDAKAIASAAGVRLVRLISITLDSSNAVSPRSDNIYFAKALSMDNAPPIESGDVSITANVTASYEIGHFIDEK